MGYIGDRAEEVAKAPPSSLIAGGGSGGGAKLPHWLLLSLPESPCVLLPLIFICLTPIELPRGSPGKEEGVEERGEEPSRGCPPLPDGDDGLEFFLFGTFLRI